MLLPLNVSFLLTAQITVPRLHKYSHVKIKLTKPFSSFAYDVLGFVVVILFVDEITVFFYVEKCRICITGE